MLSGCYASASSSLESMRIGAVMMLGGFEAIALGTALIDHEEG